MNYIERYLAQELEALKEVFSKQLNFIRDKEIVNDALRQKGYGELMFQGNQEANAYASLGSVLTSKKRDLLRKKINFIRFQLMDKKYKRVATLESFDDGAIVNVEYYAESYHGNFGETEVAADLNYAKEGVWGERALEISTYNATANAVLEFMLNFDGDFTLGIDFNPVFEEDTEEENYLESNEISDYSIGPLPFNRIKEKEFRVVDRCCDLLISQMIGPWDEKVDNLSRFSNSTYEIEPPFST